MQCFMLCHNEHLISIFRFQCTSLASPNNCSFCYVALREQTKCAVTCERYC
uniref:Uncharacterized protein n=1 Tax=Arundo donax TaxID=35708 RepID=A0A0A9BDZ6_ARUDO